MVESEDCIGTEAWCSRLYAQQSYTDAETCFYARRIPWHYISLHPPGCRAGNLWHERCQGTEGICMGIQNTEQRAQCFARRRRPPWVPKASRSCPASTAFFDERCLGTDLWCEMQSEAKDGYQSVDKCKALRDGVPVESTPLPRISYLLPNHSACGHSRASEHCLGTEAFCRSFYSQDLIEACLAGREQPAFSPVYSERCRESVDSSEGCIGTEAWCQQHSVAKLWPSQQACNDFRAKTKATRSIWLYPSHGCNTMAESCIGTEAACLSLPAHLRNACFAHRPLPVFLLPQSPSCFGNNEACVGTDAWCSGYAQRGLNYTDQDDCFAMRGVEPASVMNLVRTGLLAAGRDGLLRVAGNLTTNALLRNLVVDEGDAELALAAARRDLTALVANIKPLVNAVVEKAVANAIEAFAP
ncbi:hypothetical protein CDD82_6192 [Ophiocordyceps australis]|uniref:Uncharacterized protein n=1 Tax=Ophiocordyceps australis TaxID=1399860 RepID=A0A2C5YTE2_9HYPO|nr:hypothetical protein CDD82_6192 [Ophiocordyceps australis]